MDKLTVAYFSMEVAVDPAIPTYNGGLGILAGDTLRAAADLSVPMIGMTLLYRKGYFRQHLDERGNQTEIPVD
jgi:starch phosphorylase